LGSAAIGYHFHGVPGAIAGETLEAIGEHVVGKLKARKALSGAPKMGNLRGKIGNIARSAINPKAVIPAHYIGQASAMNRPAPYAKGGKVSRSQEELVRHLLAKAKTAKKVSDKATEPLLNAPDAAIVRALNIAQQAI
jgi:hypothetical protein